MAKKRQIFDDVTEMAWLVLRDFIHPLDCSSKYYNYKKEYEAVIPMNFSEELEKVYNNLADDDGVKYKPYYFSKSRLDAHLNNAECYYYRSKPFSPARIGYGRSDSEHAKKFNFCPKIGIDCKSKIFKHVHVLLIGIDIDSKHGEGDKIDVCNMLLEHFPNAYWEKSTSGSGIHMYLKLFYYSDLKNSKSGIIKYIHHLFSETSISLENERIKRGMKCPIDKIRSYPTQLKWDKASETLKIENRTICIKIPRFYNGENDIIKFQKSPYFSLDIFKKFLMEDKSLDYLLDEEDNLTSSRYEELSKNKSVNSMRESDLDSSYKSAVPKRFNEAIMHLKNEPDAYRRCLYFAMIYSRELKYIPSVQVLLEKYVEYKLNNTPGCTDRRKNRMESIHKFISKTFDPSKIKTRLSSFASVKEKHKEIIRKSLPDSAVLKYKQGDYRNIKIVDLAALYYAMKISQGNKTSTCFSVEQAKDAMLTITGKKGTNPKIARMFKLLQKSKLIEKVGNPIPGLQGKKWVVKQPF